METNKEETHLNPLFDWNSGISGLDKDQGGFFSPSLNLFPPVLPLWANFFPSRFPHGRDKSLLDPFYISNVCRNLYWQGYLLWSLLFLFLCDVVFACVLCFYFFHPTFHGILQGKMARVWWYWERHCLCQIRRILSKKEELTKLEFGYQSV